MSAIRSQKMALKAYGLVAKLQNHELEDKYRTLALSFPSMILQAGLSQAVGFLLAKDKEEHGKLLEHLAELLSDDPTQYDPKSLHEKILQANLSEYQLLTRKALDAAGSLKRYTQAMLKSEKDKGEAT